MIKQMKKMQSTKFLSCLLYSTFLKQSWLRNMATCGFRGIYQYTKAFSEYLSSAQLLYFDNYGQESLHFYYLFLLPVPNHIKYSSLPTQCIMLLPVCPQSCHVFGVFLFSSIEICSQKFHAQFFVVYVQVVTTQCSLPDISPLCGMGTVFSLYTRAGDDSCSHLYGARVLSCRQKLPGIKYDIIYIQL